MSVREYGNMGIWEYGGVMLYVQSYGYISVLLLFLYSTSGGTLGSPDLLLPPYPMIILALPV